MNLLQTKKVPRQIILKHEGFLDPTAEVRHVRTARIQYMQKNILRKKKEKNIDFIFIFIIIYFKTSIFSIVS